MNEEATKAVVAEFQAGADAQKADVIATSFVDTAFDAATRAAVDVLGASRIALGKGAELLILGADKLGALADTLASDAKKKNAPRGEHTEHAA